jgi:3'(2'), 5'-bisphosphate nucleotidase
MTYDAELEVASRLARSAGDFLRAVDRGALTIGFKSPGDPVTDADLHANALIVAGLSEAFPADDVIGEESPEAADAARGRRIWYVDPLDGTKEFIAGRRDYAVMIGLAVDGRATLGVVFDPSRDKLYRGVVGQGATVVERGRASALAVGDEREPARLAFVGSDSQPGSAADLCVARLGIRKRARRGSMGIKACLVAAGEADLYASFATYSRAWDSCGPEAIVRAAGGRVVDLTGAELVYDPKRLRNSRGLMASSAACFDAVLPTVRAVATELQIF